MDNASVEVLGAGISMEPEMQGNKEVTISFANAVARENNRGSVRAAQKASRSARKPCVARAKVKGKGQAKLTDNIGTGASKPSIATNQGTKRKRRAVETELSGPRKLRKRA